MPVRIAEIDALAAARPFGAAFDGDVLDLEPLLPSVVAQWPVRMIAAPAIASKAPKTFSPRAMITGSLPLCAEGNLASITPSLHLPVDDAEHQLQVLSDARSPAALQLVGYASAAQRAGGRREPPCPSCACLFLRLEDFLAVGEGDPHPLADRVRVFASASARTSAGKASMRWSIGFPRRTACSLADSPSPSKAPRRVREGRW